ncbi:MAG: PepSY domain-containing protein [Tetragenococcus sp.]|nr:PepSY domain-containing protein [Tetragenococcus sp.]
MKKLISYIALLVAGLSLAACTQNGDEQTEQNSSTQTTQTMQSTSSAMSSEASETQSESTSSQAETSQSTSQSEENTAYDQDNISVSVNNAIQIYEDELPDTDITEINLDESNGGYYYEVEGLDDDNEYEMSIDAKTEDAQRQETEKLGSNEQEGQKREQDKLDLTNLLSIQEAAEIATDEAGGGQAIDWSLDKNLKITYWEVEVEDGQDETEVKINAQTGEVLEVNEDD